MDYSPAHDDPRPAHLTVGPAGRAAYQSILNDLRDPVFGYLVRMTESREDAEDLLQEVFFAVWRHMGELKRPESARSWVFAIAVNAVTDYHRRRRILRWIPLTRNDRAREADEPPSASEIAVRQAIERVPLADRQILVLVGACQLSAPAVAEILGTSPAAVHKRWQRARDRFVQAMPGGMNQ